MAGAHRPDVTAIPLGRPLPGASSNQPERRGQRTRPCDAGWRRVSLLFGFAPGGACHAADVAARAVRSYRTLSPLPSRVGRCGPRSGGLLSVALSLGSPPPDVIRRRIRMEPGLSSAYDSGGRPADWLTTPYGAEAGAVKPNRTRPLERNSPSGGRGTNGSARSLKLHLNYGTVAAADGSRSRLTPV